MPNQLVHASWTFTDEATGFAEASLAANTRSAYASDWADFTSWCATQGSDVLPAHPATVANYLAGQAAIYRPATVDRRLAAINKAHQVAGHVPPGKHAAVQAVLAGIRRSQGRPPRRMRPLMTADLRRIVNRIDVDTWPAAIGGYRDICLLLFGFAGAFRRSELAGLSLGRIAWHPNDGLHISLERSKTDQEAAGTIKALPYGRSPDTCPVCALNRWLDVLAGDRVTHLRIIANPEQGHVCRRPHPLLAEQPERWLFPAVDRHGAIDQNNGHMTGQAVNAIVRRRIAEAGISPTGYGSHSMRAGFVTEALRAGATDAQVMRQTGHRSPATVHVYDREHNPLKGNAVTKLGL